MRAEKLRKDISRTALGSEICRKEGLWGCILMNLPRGRVADFRFKRDPSERRRVFIILQLAFGLGSGEYPVREITSSFLGYEFEDTAMSDCAGRFIPCLKQHGIRNVQTSYHQPHTM